MGVGKREPGEEWLGVVGLAALVQPADQFVGEEVGVVVFLGDGVVPGAGSHRGLGRCLGFPKADALGMFAFQPDAPVAAGTAVSGEVGDVVEAVVGPVPEAVARIDGGACRRVFGQGVFDFPDFEVGLAEEGGGVADVMQGVTQDGDVFAEVDFVLENLVPALAAAGDHAGAGGHADGSAGVGAAEADAAGGQRVEVGRADGGVASAAEGVPALLVGGDEEEVGWLGHGAGWDG